MLAVVFEEGDLLNEDDKEDDVVELSEPREETINTNEVLDVEQIIDLDPWIFIDNNGELPTITRRFDDSEDDENWDPDTIVGD